MTEYVPLRARSYYADLVEEWLPLPDGYLHAADGGRIDFHLHQADVYTRPLLAVCQVCGRRWTREKPRQKWQADATL